MMNFATMSFDVVPGVMIGVLGPALGVLAAFAFAAVTYGFATLAAAALRQPDRPAHDAPAPHDAPVTPVAPVHRAGWEMTPRIALMLRSACEQPRSGGERLGRASDDLFAARRRVGLPVDPAARRPETPVAALSTMQEERGRGLAQR